MSFVVRIKSFIVIISLLVDVNVSNTQLTVSTGVLTPAQYVQNVLTAGGVTISNVTFSGDANQIGGLMLQLQHLYGNKKGVIMATGDVNVSASTGGNGVVTLI